MTALYTWVKLCGPSALHLLLAALQVGRAVGVEELVAVILELLRLGDLGRERSDALRAPWPRRCASTPGPATTPGRWRRESSSVWSLGHLAASGPCGSMFGGGSGTTRPRRRCRRAAWPAHRSGEAVARAAARWPGVGTGWPGMPPGIGSRRGRTGRAGARWRRHRGLQAGHLGQAGVPARVHLFGLDGAEFLEHGRLQLLLDLGDSV